MSLEQRQFADDVSTDVREELVLIPESVEKAGGAFHREREYGKPVCRNDDGTFVRMPITMAVDEDVHPCRVCYARELSAHDGQTDATRSAFDVWLDSQRETNQGRTDTSDSRKKVCAFCDEIVSARRYPQHIIECSETC